MGSKLNIGRRNFSGSSVPLGTKMGKILINSVDSRIIRSVIRECIKSGKPEKVKLSESTKYDIHVAKLIYKSR
jgi:hypothetical protein